MAAVKSTNAHIYTGGEDTCSHCGHHMVWGEAGIIWQMRGGRLVLCPPCIPQFLGGMCSDYQTLLENGEFEEESYDSKRMYDHRSYLLDFANYFVAFESKAVMVRENIQKIMAQDCRGEVTHK